MLAQTLQSTATWRNHKKAVDFCSCHVLVASGLPTALQLLLMTQYSQQERDKDAALAILHLLLSSCHITSVSLPRMSVPATESQLDLIAPQYR